MGRKEKKRFRENRKKMDPTRDLIRAGNRDFLLPPIPGWRSGEQIANSSIVFTKTSSEPKISSYLSAECQRLIQEQREVHSGFRKIPESEFKIRRTKRNPFEEIGRSIFSERSGLKLANLDFLFNLSQNDRILSLQQDDVRFLNFVDLCGAPGAFSQYLQFRFTNAKGWAVSLNGGSGFPWKTEFLNLENYLIYTSDKNNGDLRIAAEDFSDWVLASNLDGVDLVVADGAIPSDDAPELEEARFVELFASEIYSTLRILKAGKSAAVKMFTNDGDVTIGLIYLFALHFEEVKIVKLVSSRPANKERYLVGFRKKEKMGANFEVLRQAMLGVMKGEKLGRVVEMETVDKGFLEWLDGVTREITKEMIYYSRLLEEDREDEEVYDLALAKALWRVPDMAMKGKLERGYREKGREEEEGRRGRGRGRR